MDNTTGAIEGNSPNKWGLLTAKKKSQHTPSELSVGWDKFYDSNYKEKPNSKKIFIEEKTRQPKSLEDIPQGKKCFTTLKPVVDRRTGTKHFHDARPAKDYHRPEKRHVESRWQPTIGSLMAPDGYSCGRPTQSNTPSSNSTGTFGPSSTGGTVGTNNKTTRHIVTDEGSGEAIFLKRGEERPVSEEMTRKKSVEDARNGIGIASPGDKPYKISEHSDGYYKGEHTKPRKLSTEVSPFAPTITKQDTLAHTRLMQPQRLSNQQQQRNMDIALVKALDSFTVSS